MSIDINTLRNIPINIRQDVRNNILTERIDVNIMLKDLDFIFKYSHNEKKLRFEQQFGKLINYVVNARKP